QRSSRQAQQQAQRMEALGRLAGGIAHDFNNLLTAMIGNAGYLLEVTAPDDPRRQALDEIIDAGDRGQRFTRQLLAFSRNQVLQPEAVDLAGVVAGMGSMLTRLIGPDYRLEVSAGEPRPQVVADRGQVEQMVLNLVINARDAMPGGGAIRVRASAAERRGRAGALLEVEDHGVGVPLDLRERIFEPFFTTRQEAGGTGLGLSMIYGFVTQSGGEIDVVSVPGQGSTFRIFLPALVASTAPDAAPAQPDGEAHRDGPATVLVVDDEPSVRTLAAAMLRRAGFAVIEAGDGVEAERVAAAHEGCIDVLLTDIVMPGARGPELADRVRARRPDVRVVYMSGFRDAAALPDVERGEALFLAKPFVGSALLAAVRRMSTPAGTV
ncbi:MAG: ATP-binding protein, partial [Vicinamibacterales bacterium]